MTDEEIAREIFVGGRFVQYPWCVSFILMSLRRASSVRFLRRDQDGFGAAFGYSLLSLFFGWWGMPWGLIYTPLCIFHSATGGKDVTQEILTNLTGNPAAAQAMRGAGRRRRSLRMWLLPFTLIALPVLLFAGLVSSVALVDERPSDPKYAAFERADDFVTRFEETGADGNTPAARAAAGKISSQMKALRGAMFSESKRKSSFSSSKGEFLTWCEFSKDRAIVLIHVPELRKFNDEAKASLGKLGWTIAAAELAGLEPADRPANLVIAIRGAILYDHLLAGKLPELTSEKPTVLSRRKRCRAPAPSSGC